MKTNSIFLKALLISFFIHIIGLSLFSIMVPLPLKKKNIIEVLILPSFQIDKSTPKNRFVLKKIEESIGTQKIEPLKELPIRNIVSEEFRGGEEIISKTKIDLDIEKEEIEPEMVEQPILSIPMEKISDEIIEGPIGTRKIIYKEKIEYPLWAQKKGIEGKIKIKFWVTPDGKVYNSEIFLSSGYPEIDIFAESKFKKWLFEPIKTDKEVWGIITFNFKLK
ncbi:MAG: energy transducer TonB [bacterium]|nr:energy transducer TonB [bacterium]MDW8164828.1 energy transducer TonB [Candidatus Omnitrophota bacterium]